ncbi:hypothetical protein [Prosthecobacter sp.]|uniref:hypothetical protein n=1 Tax=Prosthecobacter sp. TaxID=1965333 RepID=UPI00378306B7
MKPANPPNPYSAPRSDVLVPRAPDAFLQRPSSTKWLLALIWIITVTMALRTLRAYQEAGNAFPAHYNPFRFGLAITWVAVVLTAFHAFKRYRITYVLGLLCLVLLGCPIFFVTSDSLRTLAAKWNQPVSITESWDILIVPPLVFVSLYLKLCYHFIFGLPSRRFYRMTQK